MIENRKHNRYTAMCKGEFINIEVDIIDISKKGMHIKSNCSIDSNTDLKCNIILKDLDIININCEIIWEKHPEKNIYYYGIQIKSIYSKQESTFNSFLEELEAAKK